MRSEHARRRVLGARGDVEGAMMAVHRAVEPLATMLWVIAGLSALEAILGEEAAGLSRKMMVVSAAVWGTKAALLVEEVAIEQVVREQSKGMEQDEAQAVKLQTSGLRNLTACATVAAGIVIGLRGAGVDVASLLALGGFWGVAIGFASRQVLENVLSALALALAVPFVPGEEVRAGEIEGVVVSIGPLRTSVRGEGGEEWSVPNQVLAGATVLNRSRRLGEYQVREKVPAGGGNVRSESVKGALEAFRKDLASDQRVGGHSSQQVHVDGLNRDGTLSVALRIQVHASSRGEFLLLRQVSEWPTFQTELHAKENSPGKKQRD